MTHSSFIAEINDLNFESEVASGEGTYVVAFGASWCAPCKRLDPVLMELAAEGLPRVRVGKMDIDEAPLTTRKFHVRGAPTIVIFRAGVEVSRNLGLLSRGKLREMIAQVPERD